MKFKVCILKMIHSKFHDKQDTFEQTRVKLVMLGRNFNFFKGSERFVNPQNKKLLADNSQTWHS